MKIPSDNGLMSVQFWNHCSAFEFSWNSMKCFGFFFILVKTAAYIWGRLVLTIFHLTCGLYLRAACIWRRLLFEKIRYSNIAKCSEKYIQLPNPLRVAVATRFGEKLLAHFRRKQIEVVFNDQPTLRKLLKEK